MIVDNLTKYLCLLSMSILFMHPGISHGAPRALSVSPLVVTVRDTDGLGDKLSQTEGGIWVFKGKRDTEYFTYVLQFGKEGKVAFSHQSRNGAPKGAYTVIVLRRGTYTIKGDIVELHFTTASGTRYGVDPLTGSAVSAPVETELKADMNSDRLTITLHKGTPLFDEQKTDQPITFVAEKPIID